MPFPSEHSLRLKTPGQYDKFRRVNDKMGDGIDAIFGIKKGKAELQAVRFDKDKYTVNEVHKWAKDHDKQPLSITPATHMSASDVVVRGAVQNVSENPRPDLFGQAAPRPTRLYMTEDDDIPDVGQSGSVSNMPLPEVKDPKSGLTNQQIKSKQIPNKQDIHTLEHEQKDLSKISYGNQTPIETPAPKYGAQRSIPSAYNEYDEEADPRDVKEDQKIRDLYDVDPEELEMGQEVEKEHTNDPNVATQIAIDHLKEIPDYYTRLHIMESTAKAEDKDIKALDHAEIETKESELKATVAMGIKTKGEGDQLAKDETLTQTPVTNIHQDAKGEVQMKRDEPIYTEAEDDMDDELKDGTWVEAFRSGTHTDSDGNTRKWEPKDVESVATQYNQASDINNPSRHIAPVVVGHPKDNSPAFGWIEKAKAVGGRLMLKLSELQPEFVDALKKGLYKTRSISLYPDLNIRHIGFLGGSVPAVKGLAPFKFTEEDKASTYEFEEGTFVDVNEIKKENSFFKKLFDTFHLEVTKFKEGTSGDLQTIQTDTVKTIDGKFPEGATMSESKILSPHEHLAHAFKALENAKAIVGRSGTDIEAKHAEHVKAHEHLSHAFCMMHEEHPQHENLPKASMHLANAHSKLNNIPEEPAEHRDHYEGIHNHLMKAHSHLSKMAADHEEGLTSGNTDISAETPSTDGGTKPGGEPEPGTKAIPVKEVKDDKDKLVELENELAVCKKALAQALADKEALEKTCAEHMKQDAMQSYKEFTDTLVASGQLLPRDVAQIHINMKLREETDLNTAKDFTEKKTDKITNYFEEYKTYLSTLPRIVDFSEIATKQTAINHKEDDDDGDGCDYVEKKVKEYSEKMSYAEALNKLSMEEPEKVQRYLQATVAGNI